MAEKIITTFNGVETKNLVDMKASTLDDLRKRAETLASIVNSSIKDGNQNPVIEVFDTDGENVTAISARDLIDVSVKKYNAITRTDCYTELKESGNPIVNACIRLMYPTIKSTEKKVGAKNRKVSELSIVDDTKVIDLKKLDEFCGGACVDSKWYDYVQAYNSRVMLKAGDDLEIPPEKMAEYVGSYYMSDLARQIANGETPTSNTQLLKYLQMVVDAMIGNTYKATSKHVKHGVHGATGIGKVPTQIKCASHGTMCKIILGTLNTIITGGDFDLTFKTINK